MWGGENGGRSHVQATGVVVTAVAGWFGWSGPAMECAGLVGLSSWGGVGTRETLMS